MDLGNHSFELREICQCLRTMEFQPFEDGLNPTIGGWHQGGKAVSAFPSVGLDRLLKKLIAAKCNGGASGLLRLQPQRIAMRYVTEGRVPPAPGATKSACPADRNLVGCSFRVGSISDSRSHENQDRVLCCFRSHGDPHRYRGG